MSLTIEEVEKTFADTIASLQSNMDIERADYKKKIKTLEDEVQKKDALINENYLFIIWGLGIGDWGLGIGDWAQSPIQK